MTFEKIQDEITRVESDDGFLIIRKLKPSENTFAISDEKLISSIIRSKYHHWRGEEEPNGLSVNLSSNDKYGISNSQTLVDYKFYGFFDNTKIKSDHYVHISFDEFNTRLMSAIAKETENDNVFIQLSKKLIDKYITPKSKNYFLDLDIERNKDMLAEWHVYDFFYAFISIDTENNYIYLVEFGYD